VALKIISADLSLAKSDTSEKNEYISDDVFTIEKEITCELIIECSRSQAFTQMLNKW